MTESMRYLMFKWVNLLTLAGVISIRALAQPSYEPYTFVTLAGAAESGPGSLDGIGNAVRFNGPAGAVVDITGNIYVADVNNHTIRKINPSGTVTTVAGLSGSAGGQDGVGARARFNYPQDVALDTQGNLIVADSYNHCIRRITPSGSVSTVAGLPGTSGSADGSRALARFNYPFGVAVGSDGLIYVADSRNHTLRRIAPDGAVTTVAGLPGVAGKVDGLGGAARFTSPQDLVVDGAGTVFMLDGGNHAVRKVNPTGAVTTLAGSLGTQGSADGAGNAARFLYPCAITLSSSGDFYVADTYNQLIRRVTPTGVVTTLAGAAEQLGAIDGTGNVARFNHPLGIAAGSDQTVYVVDTYNHTVRKISPGAAVTTLAGVATWPGAVDGRGNAARFNYPQDVALDSQGNLYVPETANHAIRKVSSGGVVSTFAGLAGASGSADGTGSAARFNGPVGVAVDRADNVYVADSANHTIRRISPAGAVTTIAGRAGRAGAVDATGGSARFQNPFRLAVDLQGNVYVADTWNHTIRKITPSGAVTTVAGTAGTAGAADRIGTAASFSYPEGLAIDPEGNLYVADDGNHTIRKITAARVVSTLAGSAGKAGSTDGNGAAARFSYPFGLAIDQDQNLYVTDAGNHTLRRITPAGTVTTLTGTPGTAGSTDGTGAVALLNSPAGVVIDKNGSIYLADAANHAIRRGFLPLPDHPVVTPSIASAGVPRQLAMADTTTRSWSWTITRFPAAASAVLTDATTATPSLTPDIDDLYVLRVHAWDSSGKVAIQTIAVPTMLFRLTVSPSAGSPPGTVDIGLQAPVGSSGKIEQSPDLSSWSPLATFTMTNTVQQWRDSETSGPGRKFYRAVTP